MRSKCLRGLLLTGLLFVAAGCGKSLNLAEVEGTVKLDGKPLPNVRVAFNPDPSKGGDGLSSAAETDDQGHFVLVYSYTDPKKKNEQGAQVGWHKVTVEDTRWENGRENPATRGTYRVPRKYVQTHTTPIAKEVKSGKQTIDVELESK